MKTLKKFTTSVVEIKLSMTSSKDNDYFKGIYKVTETPKSKKSDWKEEIAYYNHDQEAKKDMRNRINFWLR